MMQGLGFKGATLSQYYPLAHFKTLLRAATLEDLRKLLTHTGEASLP